MTVLEVKLWRPVSGRALLAAAEAASTEGEYHSRETPKHTFFAGQYNSDSTRSLLVSGAPTLCEEPAIKLDAEYSTVWIFVYLWSLPYGYHKDDNEAPRLRFAARIMRALGQS